VKRPERDIAAVLRLLALASALILAVAEGLWLATSTRISRIDLGPALTTWVWVVLFLVLGAATALSWFGAVRNRAVLSVPGMILFVALGLGYVVPWLAGDRNIELVNHMRPAAAAPLLLFFWARGAARQLTVAERVLLTLLSALAVLFLVGTFLFISAWGGVGSIHLVGAEWGTALLWVSSFVALFGLESVYVIVPGLAAYRGMPKKA
jgi:hypothetical protein